jgi:hypothetical protein
VRALKQREAAACLSAGAWLHRRHLLIEAIAAAAYDMTFWYMSELGASLYANAMPKEWEGMSPQEARRNAAKMMLYCGVLRARTVREESRGTCAKIR